MRKYAGLLSMIWSILTPICAFSNPITELPESGAAFTDMKVVRQLEEKAFGIGQFLVPGWDYKEPMDNEALLKVPSMATLKGQLAAEIERYKRAHPEAGVGMKFDHRTFDWKFLSDNLARFVLVGVVNRMDRAYKDPASCGEIRFIYRLAYRVISQGEEVLSRLPMTANLVLRAKNPGQPITCQEIAKRWLDYKNLPADPVAAAEAMIGPGGVLEFARPDQIDRLELDMQIVRWPSAVKTDLGGHAEYLLKVFKFNSASGLFEENVMENQIDREKLLKDKALLSEFKKYMMSPEVLKNLDSGLIDIPEKFLATTGISTTPGGYSRSQNRVFYKLFSDDEIAAALDGARKSGVKFSSLLSVRGVQRKMNDVTCVGCHQSRAIGGFHFMGHDPALKYPGNSVFVPTSPHFLGDMARRRDILKAFAEGRAPDFSKDFAARPQERRSQEFEGTGLLNGWSAHCYSGADASYQSWKCAMGFTCRPLHEMADDPGMGICVNEGKPKIGDPMEVLKVTNRAFGDDVFTDIAAKHLKSPSPTMQASPQSGGFPGGNLRTKECKNLPPEAVCGPLPAAKPGFNGCVGGGKNFVQCLKDFSVGVGLRGCDKWNPCRDDYICTESYEQGRGVCAPPYFLFQFRVDGHPISYEEPPLVKKGS